ncbi:MAG TPA: methylated-DNA--[protein]-cysteine S-methyltransferase [Thermoanaerobaculia bacterium]|jgi:methylated-DNA-[protein]-cysteine S-methyltransferase|nr:methylated-DNA--[protein]-cysteine S-methyltransferase [Thermoanaerobaculia bacterium]
MSARSFAVFETALGHAAIAWGERGVVRIWLPDPDGAAARRRVGNRLPEAREDAPPPAIREAIARITDLLAGAPSDLSGVPLDLERIGELERSVYEIARTIPPGETRTYGEIASRLGDRSLAREVGRALAANPFPLVVPCHRVLAANGKPGGFSAPGGVSTKLRLLEIEGARTPGVPTLFT